MPITQTKHKNGDILIKRNTHKTTNTLTINSTYLREVKKGEVIHKVWDNGKLIHSNEYGTTYNTRFIKEINPDLGSIYWWSNQVIIDEEQEYKFDVFQWGDKYVIQDAELSKFEVTHVKDNIWKLGNII